MANIRRHFPGGPAEAARTARRVTSIGLVINVALSAAKFAAGVFGGSQAMVADAIHSLSDTVTDIAVIVGSMFWQRPPDEDHPHGHGRIETAVTVFIGTALAAVAVGLIYNALTTFEERHSSLPAMIALWAALGSIVIKEILYRWTAAVAAKVKSPAMAANAWHHRSDALSSIPAAAAVAGARLLPGAQFLDHLGAVVVAAFILHAAWRISWPAINQLIDAGAPAEIIRRVERAAMSVDGVRAAHKIRARHIGSGFEVNLHVLVDPDISVRAGHDIATATRGRVVFETPDVVDVIVHIEPAE
ncbi:MAG: Ferrous-iron efflux pump FieF [bacterium ADurb.Bin236]|nr:MAG: Ferrous-iron efflux pump FieF [bacterium ADurb.Bin236]HPN95070.1 cation diffusion facilitator family transporter [bacterium]